MKKDEEVMYEEMDYHGPVKIIHKGFLLDTLEELINELIVGSYLVMKSTKRVTDDRTLITIGYITIIGRSWELLMLRGME